MNKKVSTIILSVLLLGVIIVTTIGQPNISNNISIVKTMQWPDPLS